MIAEKVNFALKQALILLAVLVTGFILNTYFVALNKVQGQSMAPTLAQNSFVISVLNPIFNSLAHPKVGEIYILRPVGLGEKIVKRLIAKSNDQVWIDNGIVYVNGESLSARLQLPKIQSNQSLHCKYFAKIVVPPEKYFFLGDNLCEAMDSRNFGALTSSEILGHVIYRFQL